MFLDVLEVCLIHKAGTLPKGSRPQSAFSWIQGFSKPFSQCQRLQALAWNNVKKIGLCKLCLQRQMSGKATTLQFPSWNDICSPFFKTQPSFFPGKQIWANNLLMQSHTKAFVPFQSFLRECRTQILIALPFPACLSAGYVLEEESILQWFLENRHSCAFSIMSDFFPENCPCITLSQEQSWIKHKPEKYPTPQCLYSCPYPNTHTSIHFPMDIWILKNICNIFVSKQKFDNNFF